jgi:hypothetical protein
MPVLGISSFSDLPDQLQDDERLPLVLDNVVNGE